MVSSRPSARGSPAPESLAPYVALYVRKLLADASSRKALVETLESGRPHVVQEEMMVCMLDVSGYSLLTSKLFEALGKMSSEVVSNEIGQYVAKMSDVVMEYGGDIIKFLGDAILVTFPPWRNETREILQRRALDCCSRILRDLGEHEVNFSKYVQSYLVAGTKLGGNGAGVAVNSKELGGDSGGFESSRSRKSQTQRRQGSVITPRGFTLDNSMERCSASEFDSLALHIAVTFGTVSHIIVGSTTSRLDYFVTGECLSDLEALLEGAVAGEMAVSPKGVPKGMSIGSWMKEGGFWKVGRRRLEETGLPPMLEGRDFIERYQLESLSFSNVEDELLPLFINHSLYYRLRSHGNTFQSEYRSLSTLFIKFLNTPTFQELQSVALLMFGMLSEYQGTFQQFCVDDKGCTLLAYFGLPPFSTEKNCLQAVQASCAFLLGVRERRNNFAVSIATGESLFTRLGTYHRKEAGLLGVVCNRAARLLKISYAENLVALDAATYEAIKLDGHCLDLGLHMMKGFSDAIRVFGVEPTTFTLRGQSVEDLVDNVIGNREEFAALEQTFNDWKSRAIQKHVFLVEGMSGMGKSSLLAQMTRVVRKANVPYCIARGSEVDLTRPFCFIRRLVISLLAISNCLTEPLDPDLLANAIGKLIRAIKEDEVHIPLILEWLIPGRGKQYSEVAAIEAKWDSQRLIIIAVSGNMLRHILGTKRVVVFLDDFQWIDPASLEVIQSVTRLSSEIMFLAFSRPLTDPKFADALNPNSRRMLKGLSKDDIRSFMLKRLGTDSIQTQLIDTIFEKTQGSLLQVDTLVAYMKDNPEILEVKQGGDRSNLIEFILSKSLEAVIITQLDKLDSFFQDILRSASIIGHYIQLTHLLFLLSASYDSAEVTAEMVQATVKENDKFGFMVLETNADGSVENLSFRHIVIRNAIYESQAVATRQRQHLLLAEFYETGVKEEEKKHYLPLSCYHYWRCGVVEKMVLKKIELGLSLADDGLRAECVAVLMDVFNYIDEQCDRREVASFLPPEIEAKALSRLAFHSFFKIPLASTRTYAIRAVEILQGETYLQRPSATRRATFLTFLRILRLTLTTRNGRRDARPDADALYRLRHESLHDALCAMIITTVYDGTDHGPLFLRSLFFLYANALELCATEKVKYVNGMDLCAGIIQRSRVGAAIGMMFEKRARELWDDLTLAQQSRAVLHIATSTAYLLDTAHAKSIYDAVFPYWQVRKDPVEIMFIESWVFYSRFLTGDFADRAASLLPFVKDSIGAAPILATSLLYVLLYEAFAIAALESLTLITTIYDQIVSKLPPSAMYFAGGHLSISRIAGSMVDLPKYRDANLASEIKAYADHLASAKLESNISRAFFSTILLTLAAFALPKPASHTAQPAAELRTSLAALRRAFQKTHLFLGRCASRFLGAALLHLSPGPAPRGELLWFKRTLTARKFRSQFCDGGGLVVLGALFCAMVGKLSRSEVEQRRYASRAAGVFEACGAVTLRKWALEGVP
ncbi:hypothetical protein HDU96_010406 [Phlyctochytrium bullatum]|nr:hypothetical protein HDU96_010406 [Phlyctochytrium bullatum]